MKLCFKNINKNIACLCLFIYVLFGLVNTNGVSICYGSEHYKHMGINIFGYKTCCGNEKTTSSDIFFSKMSKSTCQQKCNCVDKKLPSDNSCQQMLKNNVYNTLSELDIVNAEIYSLINYFDNFDKNYNKDNWNIYNRWDIDNSVVILKTVMLII